MRMQKLTEDIDGHGEVILQVSDDGGNRLVTVAASDKTGLGGASGGGEGRDGAEGEGGENSEGLEEEHGASKECEVVK